ncbi:hypothetical protein MLD38_032148 [Melastoma candidum]|uniref:Uncharacterized protein n=1 Tax=Melastoma candidum TaxID=119954 RepID=A0ACB9M2X9_9MYRT|nr:hypothetical protein MLD38_032148 [Melastoma candidum]
MGLLGVVIVVLFAILTPSLGLIPSHDANLPYPKAIADLKEAIVKGLGFQADEFKVSGFDLRDALVGHSVAYEFDVEVDSKVLPFKLLEDVSRWEFVDLPIFRVEEGPADGEKVIVEQSKRERALPVLEPFQLAGPMELWIQDAEDMRLSLPHDVDAGVLKKVILADGAVVTVTGARSVSLRRPVDFPLPLNITNDGFASGLLTLAEQLHHVARGQSDPLLSLRIVGPTSLTSPSSSPLSSTNKLKLKRLAPGLVELSSLSRSKAIESYIDINPSEEAKTLLSSNHFATMWPVASVNASNSNLRGFEALLTSVLGPKANEKGSFRLLKADVSAQTYVKIGFGVEKKLKEGEAGVGTESYPKWRTKPESVRVHFEVLAKVDGEKIVPERVIPVQPVVIEDTVAPAVLTKNVSMSSMPIVHAPSSPFTL